ncbi:MAG: SCO family protein, partial [Anaerolineae bacterium]|nr:SCO family protein [Anaerolineae bacterium]
LLALLVIGVLLLAIFAVLSLRSALNAPAPTATPSSGVIVVSPPIETRDFSLPGSSDGQPVSLSDLRGKWTLLFFGYTHCPDFCPLTLAEWVNVKRALGDDADQLNFLFISVDGERDTPDVMRQYLSRFDPSFVGMSSDPETLAEIGPDYGLDYTLHTEQGENYTVDHTTRVYLLDPQSRIAYEFSFGTDRDAVIQTIQAQLAGGT